MSICLDENCTCPKHHILNYIKEGKNEVAKSVLQEIENLSQLTDTFQRTLLHYSAGDGNAEMTKYLIDKDCKVNAQDDIGNSPLTVSIYARQIKTTKILLQNNANIYVTSNDGISNVEFAFNRCLSSSLFDTFHSNKSHVILKMVFKQLYNDFSEGKLTKFLLNASDSLKFAMVVFGNAEITRYMLQNGYEINCCELKTDSVTALHCTILLARFDNAKILIEHGANVDTLDYHGSSPLRYYIKHFEVVDENSEVLKSILRQSTSLSRVGENDLTDLEYLLVFGKKKTVKAVLQSGFDVKTSISRDKTLLSALVENPNADVLDLLDELNIKFDVNARDKTGMTALMEAVYFYGCPRKVEFLLRHGADVNIISSFGKSALSDVVASLQSRSQRGEINLLKITKLLLQYGAKPLFFFAHNTWSTNISSPSTKLMIAHVVMLMPSWPESTLMKFKSCPTLAHFHVCVTQIEEMKHFKVHGTVTLFKLLSERMEKIVIYTRNQEFRAAWSIVIENLTNFESYYVEILQTRVSRAIDHAKLQDKIVPVIEALTGIYSKQYHAIVYKIINYLDRRDYGNLCEVERFHKNGLCNEA